MSTSEIYLSDEDIADFISNTKEKPQYFCGYEGAEYGVCPFITFYVYHEDEDFLPLCDKIIRIHQTLEGLIDSPYKKRLKNSTETWFKTGDKRLPDLRREASLAYQNRDSYWLQATDMDSPSASARWAIDARVTKNSAMRYTTLKITFRHSWYLDNKARWQAFVLDCLTLLEPEQCYSGFEIGNTCAGAMGAYESDVMERICAEHFYGLDIDHPSDMGFQYHRDEDGWVNVSRLGAGIRTPTWCFLLSPVWLKKLGKTEIDVRLALSDARIQITRLPRSDGDVNLWIQLGDLSLYPVDEGVPDILAMASRLIRPIRCNDLNLLSLDPWDKDPNPRFNFDTGPQWMARFDDDSLWPSPAIRRPPPPPPRPIVPQAFPGDPCPIAGTWYAVHLGMKEVDMKLNEPMPGPKVGPSGMVIWYFKG